jgi:hypothetical protein
MLSIIVMVQNCDFNIFHALLELFCLCVLAFLVLIVKVSDGNI